VNILGVGNVLMGDDGVGVAAVRALADRPLPPGAVLHDAGLAVGDVLGTLDPDVPVLVIDALRAGGGPGSVYRCRLDEADLDGAPLGACLSLHELSVVPALRLEAIAGRRFRDVTVFGVEPQRVEWSVGLSAAVAGALDKLLDAVEEAAAAACGAPAAGVPTR
jgi:hydrogenase maturation protease